MLFIDANTTESPRDNERSYFFLFLLDKKLTYYYYFFVLEHEHAHE